VRIYTRCEEGDTLSQLPDEAVKLCREGGLFGVSIKLAEIPDGVTELLVFPPLIPWPHRAESPRDICECGLPRAVHVGDAEALRKAGIPCAGFTPEKLSPDAPTPPTGVRRPDQP